MKGERATVKSGRPAKIVACYVRVSTVGQNEAGQRAEIERWLTGNGIDSAIRRQCRSQEFAGRGVRGGLVAICGVDRGRQQAGYLNRFRHHHNMPPAMAASTPVLGSGTPGTLAKRKPNAMAPCSDPASPVRELDESRS